jgi:hypothetical protein
VHELNAAAVSITGASVNGHITAPLWSAMQKGFAIFKERAAWHQADW